MNLKLKSSSTAMVKRSLLLVVAAVMIAVIAFGALKKDDSEVTLEYFPVARGDFLVSVVEGGTLEAVNEIIVRNELEGTSRIIYLVPEGTEVEEGDLVVEFDGSTVEDQLNQQEISYEKSVASYIASTNNLLITKSTADSDIRAAELKVKFAKMDLEKFDELEAQYQERNAQMDITTAESALEVAEEKLNASRELAEQGFETKRTLDIDSLDVEKKRLEVERMQTYFEMLTKFDLSKEREQLQENLEEYQKELERITTQAQSRITQAMADSRSELNTLTLNSNKLVKTQRQMDSTKLFAPQSGFVVYPQVRGRGSSESMIEEGATSRYRQELIKLPDTSRMKVTVKVDESNIGQISMGQAAFVTLDSLPDSRFRGEVTKVAPVPDTQDRFMNPDLIQYSTEITILDKMPSDLKPGVSARAEIVITNLRNVLKVPNQTVTSRQGQTVCFVKKGNEAESVPVEIGLYNTKFIEIKNGLEEGDLVLLSPPLDYSGTLDDSVLTGNDISDEDLKTNQIQPTAPPAGTRGGQPEAGARGGFGGGARGGLGGGGGRGGFDMTEFDTDGDGQLNDEEREAMRELMGGRGGFGGGGAAPGGF